MAKKLLASIALILVLSFLVAPALVDGPSVLNKQAHARMTPYGPGGGGSLPPQLAPTPVQLESGWN